MNGQPTIAILPWGNVLEDFLTPLGVTLDDFRDEFMGSWVFGYATAMQRAGLRPVLFYTSAQVSTVSRFHHRPTGATICLLPVPRIYRWLQRWVVYPYGQTVHEMFGETHGTRRLLTPVLALVQLLLLYLTTPPVRLAQELRRENCVALLCQEYEYPRFDLCVLLGKLLRLPVVAVFQGGNYHHSRLEHLIRPLAIRSGASLIIADENERARVLRRYAVEPRRITQIANPVNLLNWSRSDQSLARTVFGIPGSAKVVVWHGRIALHNKGLDLLLDAWTRLCEALPGQDLRLILIGNGDDADELQRRIEQLQPQGLSWIPSFIHDPKQLSLYLSAADVYAFPSRHEGFPVAPLEAMACGLPVVAAATSGVRAILPEGEASGGVVVDRDNPEMFAQALARLLGDDALRNCMGQHARRRIESAFSTDAVGAQLRELLVTTGDNPMMAMVPETSE